MLLAFVVIKCLNQTRANVSVSVLILILYKRGNLGDNKV